MPLARIVARIPETAASLASYLSERGYRVEVVTPGQILVSSADIEITLETCAGERALERAAELAYSIDADVVVASGAIPDSEPENNPAELASTTSGDSEVTRSAWLSQRSQVIRETAGHWQRQGRKKLAAAHQSLSNRAGTLWDKGLSASNQWGARTGKWAHASLLLLRQRLGVGSAALRQAWLRAGERAHLRALEAHERRASQRQEQERRIQEIAALRQQREETAALEAARLRAQQEQAPAPSQPAYSAEPETEEAILNPITPSLLRPAARRRSPLVAYTRNRGRDWKMAFLGAAAASTVIMLVSFSVVHKPLPQNDVQQKLPFGTAAAQPQPPPLVIPATSKPLPLPVVVKKNTPVSPKPQVARAPETELPEEDEYVEEIVVRHYPTHQSAKARTDEDGVKRISDLE
jgi:hypothetical protein